MAVGSTGGDGSAVPQCGQKWVSSTAAQVEMGWQYHSWGGDGSALRQCGQKWVGQYRWNQVGRVPAWVEMSQQCGSTSKNGLDSACGNRSAERQHGWKWVGSWQHRWKWISICRLKWVSSMAVQAEMGCQCMCGQKWVSSAAAQVEMGWQLAA